MARYINSPWGTIIGKTSTGQVGSTWKGIAYMKSLPMSYNDAKTLIQEKTRRRFNILNELSKLFRHVTKIGFKRAAVKMTEHNYFTKVNNGSVIVDNTLDATIEYQGILVSEGGLEGTNATLSATRVGQEITVTWNTAFDAERQNDEVLFAYKQPEIEVVMTKIGTNLRSDETAIINLPKSTVGNVYVWIFFKDPVTQVCSRSEGLLVL